MDKLLYVDAHRNEFDLRNVRHKRMESTAHPPSLYIHLCRANEHHHSVDLLATAPSRGYFEATLRWSSKQTFPSSCGSLSSSDLHVDQLHHDRYCLQAGSPFIHSSPWSFIPNFQQAGVPEKRDSCLFIPWLGKQAWPSILCVSCSLHRCLTNVLWLVPTVRVYQRKRELHQKQSKLSQGSLKERRACQHNLSSFLLILDDLNLVHIEND